MDTTDTTDTMDKQAAVGGSCNGCSADLRVGDSCWRECDPNDTDSECEAENTKALVFCLACWAKFRMCRLSQPESRLVPRAGYRGVGAVRASLTTVE